MISKRIVSAAAAMAVAVCASGCGSSGTENSAAARQDDGKLNIVCTIFPEYDWVRVIMGDSADEAEITCLLQGSTDLHSYQPTAEDMMKISSCDLLIYVGGESDGWVDDALRGATNKRMRVVNLLDVLGEAAKTEEHKEGMQGEDEEGEEPEYDEHVWLSLKNAEVLCDTIAAELGALNPDDSELYKINIGEYYKKLEKLSADYQEVVDGAENKTLVFADRFPFRYFTDELGLDYYAAFSGCSAESEASFETITFLAEKVDQLGADTVYTIENSDGKIAQSVIDSTKSKDQKIVVLDSMQSVSQERIDSGESYYSIMKKNLEVIKEDLKQ